MQWNAEGVQHKKLELQNFLKANSIDICCVQETHLNSNHRFFVRGYELYRQDRQERKKGGVCTLVRNSLSSVETGRSGNSDTESITVKIVLPDKHLNVCNIYSPPDKQIRLPSLPDHQDNWIAVGDFNSHSPSWGYKDLNVKGEEVEDWMIVNRLVLLNKPSDTPTFYSRAWCTTSSPDLAIATDDIQKIAQREVSAQLGGSDHRPVIITVQKQITRESKLPPSWNYKKADWDLYKTLTDSNTSSIQVSKLDVDKATTLFTDAILSAAQKSIPRGRRRDYKPFWNPELDSLHKQLSDAREKMEQDPSETNVAEHNRLKDLFEKEKTTQIQSSWQEKTASLNLEKDSQRLWQLTKQLNEDNRQQRNTVLHIGDQIFTGKTAANVFAKVYGEDSTAHVQQERVREVRQETQSIQSDHRDREDSPCMTDSLTMQELQAALKKLKKKKSPGADGITNEMLKHLGPQAKRTLLQIFNLSWHSGKFPSKWKEAHIRPILKKGKDKSKPDSYRPISLLSCTGKLLERIINKRLLWHLETNNLLASTQTGYRQHRSTEDQLAYFTQDIEDAFQEKKKVLAVFFDLSKAFDRVWKEGLLLKLLQNGVHGNMYRWLKHFLFHRTARVKLDGKLSNLVKMREGVPQGGVISPTLFLVYINDLVSNLPRHVSNTLHADDLAVWCAETSTATATLRIQTTIKQVATWADKWAVKINKSKTVSTLFSLSTSKEKVRLHLEDKQVPQVEKPTFLGTKLDSRLTWKPHIEEIQERAYKKLSIMKKLAGTTWGANAQILKQVYRGTVRPVAEYASTSWITASRTTKNKLDKVQNAGLRIILGAMKTTPVREMEKTADLEPLETRRQHKALVQAEKAKRLPSHPLHTKLQSRTKNRLKRQSLNHVVKGLQREKADVLDPNCEQLEPVAWIPRRNAPQIRMEVPGIEGKKIQHPALQKSFTLEMLQERYPSHSWIHAFTDGSAERAVCNAGSGIYIKFPDRTTSALSFPVGKRSSNYRAELQALISATDHLIQKAKQQNIVLLTDSLSALQAVSAGPTDTTTRQLLDLIATLSEHNNVVLQWIPAHVGVAGNEAADRLAKEASKLPQPHPPVSYNEAKTLLKSSFSTDWADGNDGYSPTNDSLNELNRHGQTIIFRLRTGHCGLRKHMKRIGIADTAECQCGAEEQTPLHILQSCPNLEELRQKVWAADVSFQTKLWGDTENLLKTVQFITASGLKI